MAEGPEGQNTYRCWLCLEDEPNLDGMISPCACVGTNQWVHEACLKAYCLQFLANNESSVPSLEVACPICKTPYNIVKTTAASGASGSWREMLRWTSTDRSMLLRHARFFFLVMPLIGSSALAWCWLVEYWQDLYIHGPGKPLMEGHAPPSGPLGGAGLTNAARWLPANLLPMVQEKYPFLFSAEAAVLVAEPDTTVPERLHPAGISQNWSLMYVTLQYVQWYKVLVWLSVMVLGGLDHLFPAVIREMFRVDELLFASERRGSIFICGQCLPFACCKLRHFFVTWGSSHSWLVHQIFYHVFTSHVEVACMVGCDTVVALLLYYDWLSIVYNDCLLRVNLSLLRSGYFAIASRSPNPQAVARDSGKRKHS